jgi:serine/threonine protein kinase
MTIRRLGRYEIVKQIAAGGGGEIFLAQEAAGGRQVVIKCVQNLGSRQVPHSRITMLLEEARIGTIVDHPNIVKVLEVDFQEGCFYMVMEQLEGCDLREVWRYGEAANRLLPVPIVVHLIIEAAEGLHAAHECKTEDGRPLHLVHRDISPSNLFVTESGLLKILDFGVAKTAIQIRQTLAGVIKGKISYMSPEQLRGDILDRRSDVFALGVILHELLTGRRLFKRPEDGLSRAAILSGFVAPPLRIDTPLPEPLVRATMGAIQRDRGLRFKTAKKLADELRRVAQVLPPVSPQDVAVFIKGLVPSDMTAADAEMHWRADTVQLSRWATEVLGSLEDEVRSTRVDLRGIFSSAQPLVDLRHRFRQLGQKLVATVRGLPAALTNRKLLAAAVASLAVAAIVSTTIFLRRENPPQPANLPAPDPASGGAVPSVSSPTPVSPSNVPGASPSSSESTGPKAEPPSFGAAIDTSPTAPAESPGPLHERRSQARPDRREIKSSTSRPGGAVPPAKSAHSREGVQPGKLTLGSKPWANVYIGKRLLGPTPLVDFPLPAGEYTFTLVSPEAGLAQTVTLEIPAGGSVRHNVSLR